MVLTNYINPWSCFKEKLTMAYKIILEPQKSPGLLSLNEFYLRFWNNSIHKISRCQYSYISVQLTEFLHMEITNLSFKIQLDCNLLCYAFQVPSKLNESSPFSVQLEHKDPIFSPISPEPIKELGHWEQSKISHRAVPEMNCFTCHYLFY